MRNLTFSILILVSALAAVNAISSGGYVGSSTAFPYQVAILCEVIMCSGALITNNGMLSTATCINNLPPSKVFAYLGSNKYYDGGLEKPISLIIEHPQFSTSNYDNNVAVLKLTSYLTAAELSLGTIKPIPIATALPPVNSWGLVTAYGVEDASTMAIPDTMKMAYLLRYSPTSCQTYKNNRVLNSMFCAGDPNGAKDLCPADQGAPFVYQNEIVGIYNWGCSCGLSAPKPSSPVFTNFVVLRPWITQQLKNIA